VNQSIASNWRVNGVIPAPPWLETDWILGGFAECPYEAQIAYRRFVAEGKN
jgi:hypothetical protein